MTVGNGSFVNLLGNDLWSEADIVNRTEAMVRSQFSATDETIINRYISGVAFGVPLTDWQLALVLSFKTCVLAAQEEAFKAVADMALLTEAIEVQAALKTLSADPVAQILGEGEEVLNQVELDADAAARAVAQAVVDTASEDAVTLANLRIEAVEGV